MELNKLRELVAFLREAGVAKYADDKVQLELVIDDFEVVEEDDEEDTFTHQRTAPAPVDPATQRVLNVLPPDYQKAFKIRERK